MARDPQAGRRAGQSVGAMLTQRSRSRRNAVMMAASAAPLHGLVGEAVGFLDVFAAEAEAEAAALAPAAHVLSHGHAHPAHGHTHHGHGHGVSGVVGHLHPHGGVQEAPVVSFVERGGGSV
jgi:hypothetical protein